MEGYFQEPISGPPNPIRVNNLHDPSHPPGPGILTWFPSTTPFGLALGVGLPCSDQLQAGTLGLSATGSLTLFVATHVIILASDLSTGWLTPRLHRKHLASNAIRRLRRRHGVISHYAPLPLHTQSQASAHGLSPVTSSPQDNLIRPVSYYAIFKGWLLLSQPPGCFGRPTCFPTQP
eukprot:TRINITY_DN28_c0_g1_i1.p1 TRINITY_DN28_c0_g1~~TRINITY_DN28_c0_g1_i1.p1  ORF type:complete len:177 (+),score=6.01 TRINITY_DN28_c0_g1_i1:229-759(+)